MKHRSIMFGLTTLVLLSMLLGACAPKATQAPATQAPATAAPATEAPATQAATEAAGATQAPAKGGMTFVLVPKNLGNPYFDTANNGAQEAAKELGVKVLYQGPAAAD